MVGKSRHNDKLSRSSSAPLLQRPAPEQNVPQMPIDREAALHGVRDELPHSIAVTVDDVAPREDSDLTDVWANIVVERAGRP